MKLSWKLFFITTPVFVLFLTVFGAWMIQDSFQSSLDREIERCMVENQMLLNSYELTWNSLSDAQKEQTTVQKVMESFYRKRSEDNGSARVYDSDGTVLYQDNGLRVEHSILEKLDEEHNVGYEVVKQKNETYVAVLGRSRFDICMETTRNITELYQNRSDMYSSYQMGMMLLAVLVGAVILLVLFLVMRNMQKLSGAVRQFAGGQYDVRMNIRSKDEIGTLAEDFNWMAGTMNQQMERLQGEVRRQEEFTAAFAHELKTPLTSIIGYADTIRQMELSREETDMCADYIYRQGKRLQTLSYKLLEMTMADKQEIALQKIFVPEFLEEIERTTKPALKQQGIRITWQAQEGVIYGDRDLLGSLFLNLVDNARKASDSGTEIHISGLRQPGGYLLTVRDQGRGMEQEELSRITEAFYMVDKSRSRKEGGAGLGLALCQKIVEVHHAVWNFESAPGQGTKVSVLFLEREQPRRKRRSRRVYG